MIDRDIEPSTHDLVDSWLSLPEAAEQLSIDVPRIRQLLRDRQLVAARRVEDGVLEIPADFVRDGKLLKGLPGTLTLLADSGYDDDAALRWLFSTDASLPGTPVQALAEDRGTEVRRRAQALAL